MRTNWLWPLLIVFVAALLFLQAFGALPPAASDLAGRAWPLALIVLGLNALFGRRFRYANLAVIGVSAVLLTGVIVTAYSKQSSQFRADYHQNFSQALPDLVKSLRINATLLLTQIDVQPADGRTVSASFVGSLESRFAAIYQVDPQGVGTLTLTETRPAAIPLLQAIGHGKLTISLPAGIPLDDVTIKSGEGALTFDASGTSLRNLTIALQSGDIALTLPVLAPQDALGGSVHTSGGNLDVTLPTGLTLKMTIDNGKPVFNASNYLLLSGGVLQTAGTRDFQVALSAGASGTVTIKP